jgi:hypothetical protein
VNFLTQPLRGLLGMKLFYALTDAKKVTSGR